MTEWLATSCALCAQNCGLLVQVKENTIVGVKGDPDNPRSRGYLCRKGLNIANFQHHDQRLTKPLKKTASGFVEIGWDQAMTEIGARLRQIVDDHGPRSFAFMGGGGQGSHFDAGVGTTLMRGLGSQYHYSPLAQELTGYYWCTGRMLGRQNRFPIPDEHQAEMLVGIGWNGVESHQMPRAPLVIREFSRNPDKMLVIIDPRKSKTAKEANLHLALRPGTDALLTKAMIAIILENDWQDQTYLERHCSGFAQIRGWFRDFPIKESLDLCEVDYDEVMELCKLMTTRRWCLHFDLGVYMNRHSTLATYLHMLLLAICGRFCVDGGNIIPGTVVPLGGHSDERKAKTWRTVETDFFAIMGYYSPNVMAEEILSPKKERLRAVVVSGANPLRSYADTTAYEKAFARLDLLVTVELAMTETAEMSDYVLPAKTAYESYDGTFFSWNYPEIYFQMRQPVVAPTPETKETGTILADIAVAAKTLPALPDYLYQAGKGSRYQYLAALFVWMQENRKSLRLLPVVIAETRGRHVASLNLELLLAIFLGSPKKVRENAARAGIPVPSTFEALRSTKRVLVALQGMLRYRSKAPLALLSPQVVHAENLYERVMQSKSGLWIGAMDGDNFAELSTKDNKINLYIDELAEWMDEIDPKEEKRSLQLEDSYPMILNAGRHKPENANTLMRNPAWNKDRRACTAAINPADAIRLGLVDGEMVRVVTEAGEAEISLEISHEVRKGQLLIPHGFGLKYKGEVYGVNVNRLTKNTHRDRLAATPLHRFVPCRVEKIPTLG